MIMKKKKIVGLLSLTLMSGSILIMGVMKFEKNPSLALMSMITVRVANDPQPLSERSSIEGDTQFRLCSREEVRTGNWSRLVLDEAPYFPEEKLFCPASYESIHNVTFWNGWDWQPSKSTENIGMSKGCVFTKWDKEAFCDTAKAFGGNATIAIVGDSLSWEQYYSLASMLGLKTRSQEQMVSYKKHVDVSKKACLDNFNLIYRRADYLQHLPAVIEANSPNILIINRGLHYVNDDRLIQEIGATIEYLEKWQSSCKERSTKCWLFFRTSAPGHPKCFDFANPSTSVEKMETWVGNLSNYDSVSARELTYHWYDVKHQNHLMLDAFAKSELDYEVIDGYDVNILRPDMHRGKDCLHSCSPGKMDVYNRMVLHFLIHRIAEENSTAQKLG